MDIKAPLLSESVVDNDSCLAKQVGDQVKEGEIILN